MITNVGPSRRYFCDDCRVSENNTLCLFLTVILFVAIILNYECPNWDKTKTWGDPKTKFLRLFLSAICGWPIRPTIKNFS